MGRVEEVWEPWRGEGFGVPEPGVEGGGRGAERPRKAGWLEGCGLRAEGLRAEGRGPCAGAIRASASTNSQPTGFLLGGCKTRRAGRMFPHRRPIPMRMRPTPSGLPPMKALFPRVHSPLRIQAGQIHENFAIDMIEMYTCALCVHPHVGFVSCTTCMIRSIVYRQAACLRSIRLDTLIIGSIFMTYSARSGIHAPKRSGHVRTPLY